MGGCRSVCELPKVEVVCSEQKQEAEVPQQKEGEVSSRFFQTSELGVVQYHQILSGNGCSRISRDKPSVNPPATPLAESCSESTTCSSNSSGRCDCHWQKTCVDGKSETVYHYYYTKDPPC